LTQCDLPQCNCCTFNDHDPAQTEGLSRRSALALPAVPLVGTMLPHRAKASDTPYPYLNRATWGASAPLLGGVAHNPNRIVLHHTATPINTGRTLLSKLRGLQRFSQSDAPLADGRNKPAWIDLPYHYYIGWDGTVGEARDPYLKADTNTAYDPTGCLQVCLEGNFEIEWPTVMQIVTLEALIPRLAVRFGITAPLVTHKELTLTQCPGRNFDVALTRLRRASIATV
jgi:N-acetylmuramoyl-L-alanine amidase